MNVGDAMDLTAGWDFTIPEHRDRAEIYVDQKKPVALIGSPPCAAFSQLQTMRPDSERAACQVNEGMQQIELLVRLYKEQLEGGWGIFAREPGSCEVMGPPMHQEHDAGGGSRRCGGRPVHVRAQDMGQ